jgi:hypothetical protein
MNGDFEQEGMSAKAKLAIGVGAGLAVVGLLVGGFLLIRSRAAADEEPAIQQPQAGTPEAPASGEQVPSVAGTTPEPTPEEILAVINEKSPPVLVPPPTDLVYDTEIIMSEDEKKQYGYPAGQMVVYKWSKPDPESGSPAPIMVIVQMPETPIDTDGDGIVDAEESRYRTDVDNSDTDGDGLMDGYEVYRTKTDPTKEDTDGDGTKDKDTTVKK